MYVTKIVNGISRSAKELGKDFRPEFKKSEIYISDRGERLFIDFFDGKISSAQKYDEKGTLSYVKTYEYDNDKHSVHTFNPNLSGDLLLKRILIRTKDTIEHYLGDDGVIDSYFRRFGNIWKRVDKYIDKSKPSPMTPENVYRINGREVNRFLRSGEFYNPEFVGDKIPEINENDLPKPLYDYLMIEINKSKGDNRAILDSIPLLDKMTHSSHTSVPMVVYRDAPVAWLKTAKDGKLTDNGFCSTSLIPGGSLEGMLNREPTMRYTIELPVNTPYYDLTHTSEYEMLLPRGMEFEDLGEEKLRLLLPKTDIVV